MDNENIGQQVEGDTSNNLGNMQSQGYPSRKQLENDVDSIQLRSLNEGYNLLNRVVTAGRKK